MRSKLTPESKEALNSLWKFRKLLAQVLTPDLVDYIVELIVREEAHQKYLELTKDDE